MNQIPRICSLRCFSSRIIKVTQWIVPDAVTLLTCVTCLTILRKNTKGRKSEEQSLKAVHVERSAVNSEKNDDELSEKRYWNFKLIGTCSSIFFLGLAGIVQPSVINGVYFVSFLTFATWLSCNRHLGKSFARVLKIISLILMLHLIVIVLYQTPWVQTSIREGSLFARMTGLSKIYNSSDQIFPNLLELNYGLNFDAFLNPFILMATYLVITSTSCLIMVKLVTPVSRNLLHNFHFLLRVQST